MDDRILKLNGKWRFKEYPESARRMRDLDEGRWLEAHVPASIYTCLAEAGQLDMKDLYANFENYSYVSDKSWVFRKQFTAPQSILDADKAILVFNGLDTVTHIWLNDRLIGKTENMFTPHQFDITRELKNENTLTIKFLPAISHGHRLMERYGRLIANPLDCPERSYIRKARYQFGSDYSPCLPGCGIFRDIYIKGINTAAINDIHVRTIECCQHYADVKITVLLDKLFFDSEIRCDLKISGGIEEISRQVIFKSNQTSHTIVFRIERPFMWWPSGYGVPFLYNLETSISLGDKLLQADRRSFGIRTIKVDKSRYTRGNNFRFIVNNQPVYIKGATIVPPSMFPGGGDAEKLIQLVKMAADANINMLRVSAGGYYPDDSFYSLCDELGIMIWQDFMFDSAYYPDRQWFTDMVYKEALSVIHQLRSHPSVAIWCGNNKIDNMHKNGLIGKSRKFYGREIYHRILPSLITEYDPDREYIPSSIYSYSDKKGREAVNQVNALNVHKNTLPSRYYIIPKERMPEFITEFGLQSLPSDDTVCRMESGKKQVSPQQLDRHNFSPDGNAKLAFYVSEIFTVSGSIDYRIYASQVTQGRAAKRLIEHLRAHNYINKGVIYRQFNDCFPAVSHSAVDYNINPKILYFYLKRSFNPVLICLVGSDSQSLIPVHESRKNAAVLVNDLAEPVMAGLEFNLLDVVGAAIDKVNYPKSLLPFSISPPINLPSELTTANNTEGCMVYAAYGEKITNLFHLVPDKYLPDNDPAVGFSIKMDGNILSISTNQLITDLNVFYERKLIGCLDIIPSKEYRIILPDKASSKDKISYMCNGTDVVLLKP